MSSTPRDDYDQLEIASRMQWRAWLAEHHAAEPGIWVVTYKKTSDGPYVPYDDLVEEALCFAWVDRKVRRLDEQRTQLLCGPRRAGSNWSASNKARVAKLEAAGLLAPAGSASVAAAKADGRWDKSK